MPIIVAPSTAIDALATTTVSDIIGDVERDLQERFATGPQLPLLISYTDRIQKEILRVPIKWYFMLSQPQRFITEQGQTEYWIGPTGSEDVGMVDTSLNLDDVREIRRGHIYNRSNGVYTYRNSELYSATEAPDYFYFQRQDASYREGPPIQIRNDRTTPNVVSLYPAPDTGSTYEIVPGAPHSTVAAGGALANRRYYLAVTFVDQAGNEGARSEVSQQWVPASNLITVKAPQPELAVGSAGIQYNQYNVYAGTAEDSLTLQNVSPTAITADWTEPGSGLTTTGVAPPTESDIEPIRGYLIEFRYLKKWTPLIAETDTILIPDDYRDVVVAGVNWLAAQYLHRQPSARDMVPEPQFWEQQYRSGVQQMIRDHNPYPAGQAFIGPDPGMSRDWSYWDQGW